MNFFIQTFGCAQNIAESERIIAYYKEQGYNQTNILEKADLVIINSCIVREQAEDRVYGLVEYKLRPILKENPNLKIILTGCLQGVTENEQKKYFFKKIKRLINEVELVSKEKYGLEIKPCRQNTDTALIPIANGCNNFCSYCIVPLARGKEISRPFEKIISEAQEAYQQGYKKVLLIGQNVNSYGADLIKKTEEYVLPNGRKVKPVIVKSMGKNRIPTLFPYLLEEIAKTGFKQVDFIAANPWDFSSELINVIAKNKNISRQLHLPIQSGDNEILKKMNRQYTREEYLELVEKIKEKIPKAQISTDIIVGFPGESEEQFNNTVALCQQVGFNKAYISCYSPRSGTAAAQLEDTASHKEKDRRFQILNKLVNRKHEKNKIGAQVISEST